MSAASSLAFSIKRREEALAAQDVATAIKGWASIPRGGLERKEAVNHHAGYLAQTVLSESAGTALLTTLASQHAMAEGDAAMPGGSSVACTTLSREQQAEAPVDAEGGETVWLSLKFSSILFLAPSPGAPAPYAFVRLHDAVLRDVDVGLRRLVLAGRPKTAEELEKAAATGNTAKVTHSTPFGTLDDAQPPLPLCFLLADGRFQPFEALWLEFQFNTVDELQSWAHGLSSGCSQRSHMVPTLPKVASSWRQHPMTAGLGPNIQDARRSTTPPVLVETPDDEGPVPDENLELHSVSARGAGGSGRRPMPAG